MQDRPTILELKLSCVLSPKVASTSASIKAEGLERARAEACAIRLSYMEVSRGAS